MAEETWTSPVLEFYQKRVGAPLATATVAFTPDLLMRWQPLLSGVDDGRREELVVILEFENRLMGEIMLNQELGKELVDFLSGRLWFQEPAEQLGAANYSQAVKRKVLEQKVRFVVPVPQADRANEIDALRLAHKVDVEAWKRACDAARTQSDLERTRAEAWKKTADAVSEKADDRHGKWVRLQADFDNYQKRVKRDLESDRAAALRRILTDLVTVIDNAALVAENASRPEATTATITQALVSGVQVELLATLARHGGKPMGAKAGDTFDPVRHEAVSVVNEEGAPERDEILSVVREGYLIGTAILRAASVIVKRVKTPVAAPVVTPVVADEPREESHDESADVLVEPAAPAETVETPKESATDVGA